ncbi:MAG: hypothetical protein ACYSU2_15345, partial [Planctomycetota bacterium]
MLSSHHLLIVAVFAILATVAEAADEGAACTHPLFADQCPVGSAPMSGAVGDLDGVNGPDLVVANYGDDNISVLLNEGG